jgi:ornithine cyclodeaminase/alanine dehydrogenase-like protein (mu-crystallin family)
VIETLTDADLSGRLSPQRAVAAMRDTVLAAHRGELTGPPRASVPLDTGRLVTTAGRYGDRWFGYRSYDTLGLSPGDQVTVLHDGSTGQVVGIAVGELLGQYRTGALGGLAVDALARPEAGTLGLVGTGAQAFAQAWAIRAVRDLTEVTVFGRDPQRRAAFTRRLVEELGLPARPVNSAEAAVRDRDMVVLATNSATPVIEPEWVAPGTSVTTLGPKQRGRAEFDLGLAEKADLLVTDSVAQTRAYDPPFVLADTPAADRLVSLGAVLTGKQPLPPGAAIRLYCSVGLAGTEVALLAAALAS